MNQQINLLAPIFRKRQTLLSARLAMLLCVMVVAVLGVLHLTTVWQVAALSSEQADLRQRRDSDTARLNELAAQLSGEARSQELISERDRLAEEVESKSQALAALSRSELGNTLGFSPHFIGLARQRLNGLWLTRISLKKGGRSLELNGVTLSEQLLPRYLQLLGDEPVFNGTQFAHAFLARNAKGLDASQLRFELHSVDPDDEEGS